MKTVRRHDFSRFPVCDGTLDSLIGVVHVRDLLIAALAPEAWDLRKVVRNPLFVPETADATAIVELFWLSGIDTAFVADEHGGILGLITMRDLVDAMVEDFLCRRGLKKL